MYSKTTIQHILSNGLFHRVEQSVPWGGTKCSMGWNKVFHGVEQTRRCRLLLSLAATSGNDFSPLSPVIACQSNSFARRQR